jgi:hypothetical protein
MRRYGAFAVAQTLLVLDAAISRGNEWVKVLLPTRPNASAGRIPRDNVVLAHTRCCMSPPSWSFAVVSLTNEAAWRGQVHRAVTTRRQRRDRRPG